MVNNAKVNPMKTTGKVLAIATTKEKPTKKPNQKNASLDKLAQLTPQLNEKKSSIKTLQSRARAKYIGDEIKKKLCKIHSQNRPRYYNSLLCASAIQQHDDKLTSRFCNQRWCIVCSRIRTAKAIKGYYEPLNKMKNLYFLTVTIPNVASDALRPAIKLMAESWRQITNKAIKKTRLKRVKYSGIRKLEVTYNLHRNDYHPHYHVIINNKKVAEYILKRWLGRFPSASIKAQDLRPVTKEDREKKLLELFKYSTKFHAKIEQKNKTGNGEKEVVKISCFHLDKIFLALAGLRTYQPFGVIKKVSEDVDQLESEAYLIVKKIAMHYWGHNDWFDIDTAEVLSGYQPTQHDENLKESICLTKSLTKTDKEQLQNVERLHKSDLQKLHADFQNCEQHRKGKNCCRPQRTKKTRCKAVDSSPHGEAIQLAIKEAKANRKAAKNALISEILKNGGKQL
jgi:hypothetical protein